MIIMCAVILVVMVAFLFWSGFITVSLDAERMRSNVLAWFYRHHSNKLALLVKNILRITWKCAKKLRDCLRGCMRGNSESGNFYLPPVMTDEKHKEFHDAFRILFCGDLILLEEQVKRAVNGFDELFEYTRKYIEPADIAIGVFEGPMAGKDAGYSHSNIIDDKELALNYPDSFGEAVKRAGFDLVTTANNHLLDKGKSGALQTLINLDRIGLVHTGTYSSPQEKESQRIKLIEKDGLRFAFLSYTFCFNEELLHSDELKFLTSIIVDPIHKDFEAVKESVKKDFDRAKEFKPDFIVVLPHMGEGFLRKPDQYQRIWWKIFVDFGADIILSDHTHSVQPAEITQVNGRKIFTAWCPGNYANFYRYYNGDAGILVEAYIDRKAKQIIGGSIVPMWTFAYMNANYRPVPLNVIADGEISSRLTTDDLERAEEINRIITSTVFGHAFNFDMVREKYYFDERGYVREKVSPIGHDVSDSRFMRLINSHESVCFIGDSVTQGSMNGGYPYYEPLLSQIKAEVHNVSFGGGTVKTLIDHADEITAANSGLYVVAIGTNDVRYRDSKICAMTPEEYISRLQSLENLIRQKRSDAQFVYIAPWWADDGDKPSALKYDEKLKMNSSYSQALRDYCDREGREYFDVNGYISAKVLASTYRYYLNDHIHPNSRRGIYLYSEALTLCE